MNFSSKMDDRNLLSYVNHVKINPAKYEDRWVNDISHLILAYGRYLFPKSKYRAYKYQVYIGEPTGGTTLGSSKKT